MAHLCAMPASVWRMEEGLDDVAEGRAPAAEFLDRFRRDFSADLQTGPQNDALLPSH